jgi:hypothetical protein
MLNPTSRQNTRELIPYFLVYQRHFFAYTRPASYIPKISDASIATEETCKGNHNLFSHFLITNPMEVSPSWEANRSSAIQEISHILYNPTFTSTRDLSLSWPNQFGPCPPSPFLKTHFNIILPSTSRSSKWSLALRFPHQNPVWTYCIPDTCCMSRLSHSSWFNHPNNIWSGVQIIWSSSLWIVIHSPVTSTLWGPNIFLSTVFPNTLSQT